MAKKYNKKLNNKGITLIALIITIIIMLILVGVAVTIALRGELFNVSQNAVAKTQLQQDRELLLDSVVGAMNGNAEVEFDKLDSTLPNGFQIVYRGENEGVYKSNSNNYFLVNSKRTYKKYNYGRRCTRQGFKHYIKYRSI